MKSKDLQNIVLSKYQNGDASTKICHDLNGGISLVTVKRWCQMIRRTGSIEQPGTHGGPRIVRTRTRTAQLFFAVTVLSCSGPSQDQNEYS